MMNIKGRITLFVILSEAKNLLFFFSSQKSKEEILRTYVLRMTDKGKLVKILEHSRAKRRISFLNKRDPSGLKSSLRRMNRKGKLTKVLNILSF
jgi:hypothetical protein